MFFMPSIWFGFQCPLQETMLSNFRPSEDRWVKGAQFICSWNMHPIGSVAMRGLVLRWHHIHHSIENSENSYYSMHIDQASISVNPSKSTPLAVAGLTARTHLKQGQPETNNEHSTRFIWCRWWMFVLRACSSVRLACTMKFNIKKLNRMNLSNSVVTSVIIKINIFSESFTIYTLILRFFSSCVRKTGDKLAQKQSFYKQANKLKLTQLTVTIAAQALLFLIFTRSSTHSTAQLNTTHITRSVYKNWMNIFCLFPMNMDC